MALDLVVTPEALRPYDKDGIHYVPKIHIVDLVIKSKLDYWSQARPGAGWWVFPCQ